MPVPASVDKLLDHLHRIADLNAAASVLEWDQETHMPSGGLEARVQQLRTLRSISHDLLTSDACVELLEQADAEEELSAITQDLIRVTRRDVDRARRVPTDLVERITEASAHAKEAWRSARTHDDFGQFAPHLERLLVLSREKAEAIGYEKEPYDALLEEYEPRMTTEEVAALCTDLRERLIPIVSAIADSSQPDDDFLHRRFDPSKQLQFGRTVASEIGYDFDHGRLDLSTHPFSTAFSVGDVRITTRVAPDHFSTSFFGTLHEAGHALYEQGIDKKLDRTPLASGTSLGMHESQSRLWENHVGRSFPFWQHYYPELQSTFRDVLGTTDVDTFYAAINKVQPSLIRVEADEVTYNLHIMLRFELERQLIDGNLSVEDLPEAWNAGMEEYLGILPSNDAEGVLQDIHWSLGAFGYFPTYLLGTLMAAQLYTAAEDAIPDLSKKIGGGQFDDLLAWLRRHIHQFGRRRYAQELLETSTGRELTPDAWLAYVERKYGDLYTLPSATGVGRG